MPTYDYHCDACEHEFEHFQSITSEVLTKCPKCGKKKLRRLFGTGAAIVFKGSGFYTTDYRSDSYQKGAKADKSTSGGDAAKSSDKSSGDSKASSDTKTTSESKSSESKSSTKSDAKPAKPDKK